MANMSSVIKGTFTVQATTEGLPRYTINFGRSLENYIFYIKMKPESILRLTETASSTTRKAYALLGIKDFPELNGSVYSNRMTAGNYRTSDGAKSMASATVSQCTNDSISFLTVDDTYEAAGVYLYNGYTYDYIIFPIEGEQ